MNRLIKTSVIICMMINAACQSQENKPQAINKDYVPRYVNIYPALEHPEQVYHLNLEMCPRGLDRLTKLQYLYFGPCYVGESMMKEINEACSLTDISFYDCKIDELRFNELHKKKLKFLTLPVSKIANLDTSIKTISQLKSLKTLGIALSNIPYFDELWINLECLKNVYLGNDTSIFDFEKSFNNLSKNKNLEELGIVSSNLETFPSSIQKVNKLKKLDIYNCHNLSADYILAEIIDWEKLTFLGLGDMDLKVLPIELSTFQNLKSLDIAENEELDIQQALSVVSKIKGLEELNISYCIKGGKEDTEGRLDDLARLKNLKKLDISEALFNDDYFWGTISQLENLEELKMYRTPSYITQDIFKLKKLKKLDISWTGSSEMEGVEKLPPSLEELKCNICYLEEFPVQIIRSPNLKSVNLHNNDIKTVPEEIGNMENLFHLDLSYNEIEELPGSISKLKGSLKYLNIMGNPVGTDAGKVEQIKKWLPDTEVFWGE